MAVKKSQKFTEEELKNLKALQSEMDSITISFGQVAIQREMLEAQEKLLKGNFVKLKTQEAELAKSLSDKYGKGTLDIESGEFTPVE
tara:strand:+ start:868 stop:1128 length:261 start_codon:yes stop_codon:yes gene_type:complete